jgi:hypothetical protein
MLLLVTASLALAHSLAAQAPPREQTASVATVGAAVIRGRVVRADNGEPLPGARIAGGSVCVRGQVAAPCASIALPELTTDADGRFEHRGVTPAVYRISVTRAGYVAQGSETIGQVEARIDTPVELTFALSRGAAIAGRVTDDRGNDIEGAAVTLMRWRWQNGERQLSTDGQFDNTDDRGQFRLFGVPAGTYLLVAQMENPVGPERGVNAYYPAAASPSQSQPLTVRPGDELSGLTLSLPRAAMSSIAGMVTRADGQLFDAKEWWVSLTPADRIGTGVEAGVSMRLNPDGSYMFSGVRAGEYVIEASRGHPPLLRAREQVTLSGGNVMVPLILSAGHAIRGRFVFEDGVPVPAVINRFDASSAVVAESNLSWNPATAETTPERAFQISGLNGRYRLRPPAPAGYGVKRITLQGRDITDTVLDVTSQDVEGVEVLLTQRVTSVSGTVTGTVGRREAVAVVLFPEDSSKLWPRTRYLRMARLESGKTFSVRDLPPGRYLAIAVAELESGEETNPELLQRFRSRATPFTLEEGESRVLNLSMVVP